MADATGIGRPTLEIIHKEFTSHSKPNPARIEGIVFTGGITVTELKHPALPPTYSKSPTWISFRRSYKQRKTFNSNLPQGWNTQASLHRNSKASATPTAA